MIKICFVHINGYAVFNPSSGAQIGGVEAQLGFLARFLSKKSFNVSYIVGDWGQRKKEEREDIIFLKSFSLEKTFLNIARAPFLLWSSLISSNSDIFIMSSACAEFGIVSIFCKLYKKKIIYWTAHDIDCNGEYRKKNPIRGLLFEYGIKNANLVVSQNLSHARELKSYYNIDAIVIKNGFPIKNISAEDRKYVLWVARCESWKNPMLFLELARMMPSQNFVMICSKGKQELQLFETIKSMANSLSNLNFIEGVIFSDIQRYFDKAKIFIGTSDYEGFPVTYLHACVSGVPIVSYKVNPDDFITRGNVGYCANGAKNKFIENIKKLLMDQAEWQEKSENASRYIYENHDMEIIGKQWAENIQKLIKK